MAFNPIETDYRPNFGLGAYYQGINAANAKQLTEEDILKAFLANQREQQEQPLDFMIKNWEAQHAQDKNTPEYRDAFMRQYIGQANSTSAAGRKAMETVGTEIPAINQENRNKLFMGKTLEDWNKLRLEQQLQETPESTINTGTIPNAWGGELRGSPGVNSLDVSWSGPGGINRWSDWGNNQLGKIGNMRKQSNVADTVRTREDTQPPVLSNMVKEQPQGNVLSKLQNILVNTPEHLQKMELYDKMGENQVDLANVRGKYLVEAALAKIQKKGENIDQTVARAGRIIAGIEAGDKKAAAVVIQELGNYGLRKNPLSWMEDKLNLPDTAAQGAPVNSPSIVEKAGITSGLLTGDSTRRNDALKNKTSSGNKFTIEKTP